MGGCISVSSKILNKEDEMLEMGQHIVSLTSSTYGILSTLDQTTMIPPTPPPRFTLLSEPITPKPNIQKPNKPGPIITTKTDDVINSWELMAGLDSTIDSFRFLPDNNENSNPNFFGFSKSSIPTKPLIRSNSHNQIQDVLFKSLLQEEAKTKSNSADSISYSLDGFEKLCPPKGENKVVIYTTTLRGIRSTFEACNAVRAAFQGLGIAVCERDISMDRGFRDELRELMKAKESTPPRVFIKGRYLGGAEEVMKIVEDGGLRELVEGLPKLRAGHVCEGCGDIRFLPCFSCNGSCKMVMVVDGDNKDESQVTTVVVRCPDCNENGLVLCPICS